MVKPLDYSPLETDWETTLLGHKVELEWRLKVFSSTSNLFFFFLNFTTPRYTILFSNSQNHIVHVINHEWNRSMFVTSAVCFVWDTKRDFPTIGIWARFSYHAWITCDWVLEFKKTVIFVFSNFYTKLLFQEDTAVTFVLCHMVLVFVFIKDTIFIEVVL